MIGACLMKVASIVFFAYLILVPINPMNIHDERIA